MSHEVLSHAQFAREVNEEGATRLIRDRTRGPKSGAYVSTPDAERTYQHPIGRTAVKRHYRSVRSRPESYQGGWTEKDEDTGRKTVYLDRSVRTHSPALALSLGEHWGQKSIYVPQPPRGGWQSIPGPYVATYSPEAEVIKRRAPVYGGGRTR